MENPILQIRQRYSMTRPQFAVLLGVGYSQLHAHETGLVVKPQPAILRALGRMRVDPDVVIEQYAAWREEQRKALA